MSSDGLCIMNEAAIMKAAAPPGRGAARLVAPLSNNNWSKPMDQRMGCAWTRGQHAQSNQQLVGAQ